MLRRYLVNLLRYHRIDPVEYYVCDRYRVVYVENAKVACTAIKQVLFPEIAYDKLGQEAFHARLRNMALLSPPIGDRADYLFFSIFRDPVARLSSCYRDKVLGAAAHEGGSVLSTRFHRTLFQWLAGLDLSAGDISFDRFASAVCALPDALRDRHFMSQRTAHRAVRKSRQHFVGRYEDLARDWAELSRLAGLPPLPGLNRSEPAAGAAMGDSLSAPTLAHIRRSFAADYAALGYRLPDVPR